MARSDDSSRGRSSKPRPLPRSKDLDLGSIRLPPLPSQPKDADDFSTLPDDCRRIVEFVRGAALVYLDKDPNIWGVGLGLKTKGGEPTGEFAAQFCVHRKLPRDRVEKGCLLPRSVDGIPVDIIELGGPISLLQTPCPTATGIPSSCAGTGISNAPPGIGGGGTLGGTWSRLDGSGHRGLTNAHVALGFGFQDFVANLPGSIGRLFQPPRGELIFTNALGSPDNFRIMEIDTIWPILAPLSIGLPVAGAQAFVYLDCAAGDVDYRPLPGTPPLPPAGAPPAQRSVRSGIVGGGRIGSARLPLPGTDVWKIGDATFMTFGEITLSFLQIPIAVGPIVVIFDQVLCSCQIANGDSGAPLLAQSGNNYIGSCWGGLPVSAPPLNIGPNQTLVSHTLATPAHQIGWRMNLNLS